MEISSLSPTLSLPSIPKPAISSSKSSVLINQSSSSFLSSVNNSGCQLSLAGGNPTRKKGFVCNSLFGLGVPEIAVIAGVAVLVFGPKQLPEIGRSIGKTVKGFQQMQLQPIQPTLPSIEVHQTFQGHVPPAPTPAASQPPAIRPRVRARRGQATDPHSIAERLRRERIAERMKALQALVPSCNKTDRAAMLDAIIDYVKFLRLQVKVLSMRRLGGAGAVARPVADVPPSSIVEGESIGEQPAWEKWSNGGTEEQVAKLMEQDIGAAMQFLQSRALCVMPVSLALAIFQSNPSPPPDPPAIVKP